MSPRRDGRTEILQDGRRVSHCSRGSLAGARASEGTDLQRPRRQVAFDRFLARMFSKGPKATYPWVLKGGYAMELRIHSARTTKDIDLTLYDGTRLSKDPKERHEQMRAMLQEEAATRLNDYFEFLIGEAREDLEGAPEGGSRYPVQAQMDGRDFARFHVDVGIGDEVLEPLDVVTGRELARLRRRATALVSGHFGRTAICRKASCVYAAARRASEHQNQRSHRHGAVDPHREARQQQDCRSGPCDVRETGDT
jgi:Nucleotidyl transferase AbiEii toxin, Type IV TA system